MIAGIIPARYGSTRFEGKPLVMIAGKSMLQRVHEQVTKTKYVDLIAIATDDKRIEAHAKSFGANVVMTKASHISGTDRIAEAIQKLSKKENISAVINIQGDEPLIDPRDIDLLAKAFKNKPTLEIATLVNSCDSEVELKSENVVKVLLNHQKEAILFSRYPIPYYKSNGQSKINPKKIQYYKHKGIYAYRTDILGQISKLAPCEIEIAESLEQLRWLYNGYKIQTAVSQNDSIGVDVPSDIKKILKLLKK
jgi:3-deoxy-manno-octulosonate cytidylyltransferase (CMP-KDO synthetase)